MGRDPEKPAVSKSLSATLLSVCFLLTAAPVQAARILVIGDSWGVAAEPSLQQVLSNNGSTDSVAGIAVGGETAENINTPEWLQQITTALAENPDAEFVHLSLGGNDFLGNWTSFMPPAQEEQLIADILEDISAIVDHILEATTRNPDFLVELRFPPSADHRRACRCQPCLFAFLGAGAGTGGCQGRFLELRRFQWSDPGRIWL